MRKYTFRLCLIFLIISPTLLEALPIERVLVPEGAIKHGANMGLIKSFEIAKYEITNKQYVSFLNSLKITADGLFKGLQLIEVTSRDLQLEYVNSAWMSKAGLDNHPMVMVNYYGALEFCKWAGGRLPTEQEWIYAAMGGPGSKHYDFAGGNNLAAVGWFKDNSNLQSHPVGEKIPNELGIYDMSGNVWEWCQNDSLKSVNDSCVHMGGSWYAGEQPGRLDAHYGNTPMHFSNSVGFRVLFPATFLSGFKNFPKEYKGRPWNKRTQEVPGKIQCEWYDLGGEGIAYHDADSLNNGSGKLNPANGSFLNEFRMDEGVDISFTKSRDIDNSPFNLVEPLMDQLYAGWTISGEWINYTIQVKEAGMYTLGLMYTASGDGGIALWLDGEKLTQELPVPSTRDEREPIPWRQWHHWNRIDSLATFELKKGNHVITLQTVSNGNMNYDYLEFKLKK